jgi:hypothetical protein
MRDLREYIDDYVSQLSGSTADDAWHSLVEAGSAALPHVVRAFVAATDANVRLALVQVVSEWRSVEGVPFLAAQLRNSDAAIWKAALDGMVTAGPAALEALHFASGRSTLEQREWIDEAIEQILDSQRSD